VYGINSTITLEFMKNNKSNKVATLDKVLGFCNAQGAVYNPSQESIQVAALNSLLTSAREKVKAADVSRTAYENALNARQPVFRELTKLASRVLDALEVSGAPQEVIDDVKAIKRRFYSPARVPAKSSQQGMLPDGSGKAEGKYQRRLSQLDYATRVENFQKLIHRVNAISVYKPNEADLKITALNEVLAKADECNRNVISMFIAMKNDMRELNALLSEKVYVAVKTIKAYIRSVFGRNSAMYKEVVQFKFKK
jgi:hypothetical protein